MIKQLLKEGFILKSKGYYKHAIETFYKALEIDNSSSELLLEIADLYNLMKNDERALNYIEQVLEQNPTHIGSLKLLQKIFLEKGAFAEAEQTAKNIYLISKTPDNLAEIFELLNKQQKFSEIFEYDCELNNSRTLYQKSFAKLYLNELKLAEELINQVLEKEKDDKFLLLKGKILLRQNRELECEELLEEIDTTKEDSEILNFAGLVEQYRGNYKKSINHFQNAIRLNPQRDEYYYNCASTYFKSGETSSAKKYYNLAISLNPNNQNYHFALANLYYSEKHYKRAMEELTGDFFEANLLKAIILYDTGYLALARKELDKLQKIQPDDEIVMQYSEKIKEALRIN